MSLLWDFFVKCVLSTFSWNPAFFFVCLSVFNSLSAFGVIDIAFPGSGSLQRFWHLPGGRTCLSHFHLVAVWVFSFLIFSTPGLGPEPSHKMCSTQCCNQWCLTAAAAGGGSGHGWRVSDLWHLACYSTCAGLSLRWESTGSLGLVCKGDPSTPFHSFLPSPGVCGCGPLSESGPLCLLSMSVLHIPR